MSDFFQWLRDAIDKIVDEKIRLFRLSGDEIVRKYPGLTRRQVAEKVATSASWHSFGQGALYSLLNQIPMIIPAGGIIVAGGTILATGMADFIKAFDVQVELVVKIASI